MRWSWRWIGSSQTRESAGFKFVPPRNCARVIPSLVPRSTWTRTPTLLSRLAQNHSSIFLTRRHINSKKKVHLEYVAIRLVRATTKHRLQPPTHSTMPHATQPSPGLQAFILCGPGVSLNTFTSSPKDLPKALIPIANRPMVWYPLDWCYRMGVTGMFGLAHTR